MIKLVCPQCQLNLRVPRQRVPAAGAWAQCPRCQERFFINPAGSSIEDLTRPFAGDAPEASSARAGGVAGRDSSSQRLLDRVKAKRGLPEEVEYEPDLIIVYPEPALPDYAYRAASAAMLCLPLLVAFLLFSTTNSRLNQVEPPPAPVNTAVDRLNDRENPESIRADLLNIKRDHAFRRRAVYGIGYSGPESRVFNYFMNRLAPEACDGVSYLQITVPGGGGQGFRATGICLAPEGRRLEMRVDWIDQGSRITFPYTNRSEDFGLQSPGGPMRTAPKMAAGRAPEF